MGITINETVYHPLKSNAKVSDFNIPGTLDHPLFNKDSRHYAMIDGVESVELMEKIYTIEELMAWAKITSMKYRLRVGNKDDVIKETKKIETYDNYYRYLNDLYTLLEG